MAINNNNMHVTIAFGCIAIAGYVLYKKFMDDKNLNAPSNNLPVGSSTTTKGGTVIQASNQHYGYPIVYGKYNADAKFLQATLNVSQDGIIGPGTLGEIRKYLPSFPQNFSIADYPSLQTMIEEIVAIKTSFSVML